MKIVCDCGNQMNLKPLDIPQFDGEQERYEKNGGNLHVYTESDFVEITCKSCYKSIYFFD